MIYLKQKGGYNVEISRRIFEVRKAFGFNQTEFGKRIGVNRSTICNYENGNRSISEQGILSICREFHVNEQWLRTGKGEPFLQENMSSLDEFAKQQGATDLEFLFLKSYFALPTVVRRRLFENFKRQIETTGSKSDAMSLHTESVGNSDEFLPSITTAELAARLDALERKNADLERETEQARQESKQALLENAELRKQIKIMNEMQ